MKIKHVFWDWNGTLLDDVWLSVEIINQIMEKYGKTEITEDSYKQIFDFPVKLYYQRLGFDFNIASFEVVGTEYIKEYNRRHLECELHEGILHVVARFSEIGIKQTIISARQQTELETGIDHYGLRKWIPDICGLNNHFAPGKIDIAQQYVEENNINPEHTVFIGDTIHDFEVANEIGCQCFLVAKGHQSYERLQKTGTTVLNSVENVINILE